MSPSAWTRETLIEAVKEAAQKGNGVLSMREFAHSIGIPKKLLYSFFPVGGWSEIRELAGLRRHPKDREARTDDDLLEEFHQIVSELGKIPNWRQFTSKASVSGQTVARRFGGKRGTRQRYRAWLQENHADSPLLGLDKLKPRLTLVPAKAWAKGSAIVFGAPIHFRGLGHAPINEQGVVYVFGMVSSELGLMVDAIQSVYPDCVAKRCVDSKLNRWKQVRIEFEFCSSNFRQHDHDPAGCDLIVCWEHDWPECPLEVIALRAVIEQLKA